MPSPARSTRAGAGATRGEASAAPTSSTVPSDDALRRELELVEQLRRARLDDPRRALELAARHRRSHPHGALASEVAALELEALCASGDVAAARAAAERFAARWPESSLRVSVDSCKTASR